MVLYLVEPGVTGLLQQIDGCSPTETNEAKAEENEEAVKTEAEAGGGFFSILGLAKISLAGGRNKSKTKSNDQKTEIGPYAYLNLVLERMRKNKGDSYFETLDEAFERTKEEETSWVCVKDIFALTNTGGGLSYEALNRE
jgi:hypothetical protein